MNKKQISIILISVLALSLFNLFSVKAIPYEAWNNYKILNFNEGFEGLQVNFNVTYGLGDNGLRGLCQEDFEDLRFFNYETDELLYAYNESTVNSEYCEIWLKLGSSKNVTMRYNNPEANSYWSLNTFNNVIDGVVLALPLDEDFGNSIAYDYSGNNNYLNITNAQFESGLYNNALNFILPNSIAENVSPNNIPNGVNDTFTLCFWVYPTYLNQSVYFNFGERTSGNVRTLFRFNNKIYFHAWSSSDFQANLDFSVNEWQMITITFNSSQYFNAYKNITNAGYAYRYLYASDTNIISIGKKIYSFYSDVYGYMDNILLFNESLEYSQISDCYNYFPDSTIIEGSVCCRVWGESEIIFGSEYSDLTNDAILIALLSFVIGLCALLLIIIKK